MQWFRGTGGKIILGAVLLIFVFSSAFSAISGLV